MNTCKNPFQTATYKKIFQDVLEINEITNKDECLAEMDEPMGKKISVLPGHGAHRTSQCKAFVTTTTNDRLLVAIYNLYGEFYTCYQMKLCDMRNLVVKKAFGGVKISFGGKTQFGWTSMEMYIPKHDFGSDLNEQKYHLQCLIGNLQAEYPDKQDAECKDVDIKGIDIVNTDIEEKENISDNPMKARFDTIYLLADILEENGINNFKFPKGIKNEKIIEWEQTNHVLLPKSYKEFLVLSNGFRNGRSEIYPLEQVLKLDAPDEFKEYYSIGGYIGDGSLLLTDGKGEFYYGDHVNGVEQSTFEEFVDNWIIKNMKEELKDNQIEVPDITSSRE